MTQNGVKSYPSVDALADAGLIDAQRHAALLPVAARHRVGVSAAMASAMAKRSNRTDPADPPCADPADPIARQFLPDPAELIESPDEQRDPIGDDAHSPVPGVVHRYADRVLLKIVDRCAVSCRYCFRREMPDTGRLDGAALDRALDYIAAHDGIREVILTGGDPLVLPAEQLAALLARLQAIPHVGSVRIHSRIPTARPDLITDARVAALSNGAGPVWLALHVNHERELTPPARAAIRRLADAGIPLISQSVLLAGVNDDARVLANLFRALVSLRVKPYYLHHLDRAPGTAHFRVPLARGRAIASELRRTLSGLAQPLYVLDVPGGYGKVPVAESHAEPAGDGWTLRDIAGQRHHYGEPENN